MYVEKVAPFAVRKKSTLMIQLQKCLDRTSISDEQKKEVLSLVPANLQKAGAFLDAITGIWRYEFGEPSSLDNTGRMLWGTQMWPPVRNIVMALSFGKTRLTTDELKIYIARLDNPEKHLAALVEMFPVWHADLNTPMSFEVAGLGVGNKTIDWKIGPINEREIFLDVKYRIFDLYDFMDQENIVDPAHNPARIFASIEEKYASADPATRLQGGWINTQIKQNKADIETAFYSLDPTKVHFAILGDDKDDALVMVRRPEDEAFIRGVLKLIPSERYTYNPQSNNISIR